MQRPALVERFSRFPGGADEAKACHWGSTGVFLARWTLRFLGRAGRVVAAVGEQRRYNADFALTRRWSWAAASVLFYRQVQELLELLSGQNEDLELDRAALELAAIEYPDLDPCDFLAILDSYAVELAGRLPDVCTGKQFVGATNAYLFGELGFAGNARNYYDPCNSCLNEVLTSRTGIPITLSLIYMEIARRLAKPVFGIGLPGHFLVQYDDGQFTTFIDPFHDGALLTSEECYDLARRSSGEDYVNDPGLLARVSKQQIIRRMINNLRTVYFFRRAHAKALKVLDLLLAANPNSADEYKQRSVVLLEMKNYAGARNNLERYLTLAPDSPDHEQMRKQLTAIKRYIVGMN
jgi:regulator of sirC expression with transglutaminase-like and TPR domain